jgi:Tfp pilus assembly protein PilF
MRTLTYRLSLGLAGLTWICVASTLCGCNQTSGYMNNQTGQGYYEQGNYTASRRAFERALMDNPQSADYAFNVAAAMRKQGDHLAAEKMYQHALSIDPSHQPAYHGLASMLREQGRTAEARELITGWNATQPYDAESHVEMAWLQQQDGDMAGAEQSLRQALRVNPQQPAAMAQLGQIYQQTGRSGQAAGLYQRSLYLNPYQPQVQSNLAQMYQPGGPSPSPQMVGAPPQMDPTMSAVAPPHFTYMPPGPYANGAMMGQPPVAPPGPQQMTHGQPHPQAMWGTPGATPTPYYGAAPAMGAQGQFGAPLPLSNADPAHVPAVGAVMPMVPAF